MFDKLEAVEKRYEELTKLISDPEVITNQSDFPEEIYDEIIEVPVVNELLSPIVSVIPLQLIAYHVTVLKGLDVDKPRNLAKSVTVE